MPELTPLDDNRQEHFLNGEDLEPITRREHFYAGRESELPEGHQEPETREEWFIKKYRGGGGDVTVVPLSVTENGTYSEEGKAYSPVSVNVPLPQNAYLLKSVPNLPQAIASFSDGEDMVMPSLKVAIEPQQDLHGYDSPWVGGAGKNKLEITVTSVTTKGVTFTVNDDGTIKANGTASSGNATIVVKTNPNLIKGTSYILNGCPQGGGSSTYRLSYSNNIDSSYADYGSGITFTEWEGNYSSRQVYLSIMDGATVNNLTFKPMIRLASVSDDTFAPYSNICPISGWTEEVVTRTGKNQFDKSTIVENKIINNNTGEETVSYGRFTSDYIKVNPSTDYYASNVIKSAQWYCVFYYDKNKNYLSCGELSSTGDTASGVVTTPSGCNYARLVGVTTYKDDVSFVVGNQAPSSYSAYNGQTYTIDLDGTYYGGEVDVVNGTVTPAPYYASYNGETLTGEWISDRDKYEVGATPTIGAQVVNIGASGTPVSILPTAVKSLLGSNNVWADTGDITDAEYFSKEV